MPTAHSYEDAIIPAPEFQRRHGDRVPLPNYLAMVEEALTLRGQR